MNELSKDDMKLLYDAHTEIDEELIDERKGIPQTRYIIEVREDHEYFDFNSSGLKPVPKHLIGFWMQEFATDNRYETARDILKEGNGQWVRCKSVQVMTETWEPTH